MNGKSTLMSQISSQVSLMMGSRTGNNRSGASSSRSAYAKMGSGSSFTSSVIGMAMKGSGLLKTRASESSMSRRTVLVSKQLRGYSALSDTDLVANVDLFQCVLTDRGDLIKRYVDLRGLTTLNLRKYGDGKKGPTLIQWAYLYKKFEMGRMLIDLAAEHVLDVVNSPMFAGENVLHMAIIHGKVDEVRHLCSLRGVYKDRHGVFRNTREHPIAAGGEAANKTLGQLLCRQPANGTFFARHSPYDFGELPLFFAVATNQLEMVDTILVHCFDTPRARFYALIECNRYGDNVLHYCARLNLVDMYTHLVSVAMNILDMFGCPSTRYMKQQHAISAFTENTEYHLLFKTFAQKINLEGFTPLTIAAAMGHKEIFSCIMATWR